MPRGGRRPGSGRPKGIHTKHKSTLDKEAAREVLRCMVKAQLEPMVEAQIAHAKGLKYLVVRERKGGKFVKVTEAMARASEDGKLGEEIIEVWEKEPSILAFSDLMNRTLDKPTETLDATLNGTVTHIEERLKAGRERIAKRKNGNGHRHS